MTETEYAYVGIKDGTIRAIVFDDTRYPNDTARLVADWLKMGRTIERLPADAAVARMQAEHHAALRARK